MTNLRAELDTLAAKIAKNAALSDTSLQESVDALKALTSYYAATQKVDAKGGGDEPDEDAPTFSNFSAQIAEPKEGLNGRTQIRGRRRDA